MEASIAPLGRGKSSLIVGAAFLLLFGLSFTVAALVPVIGAFVAAGLYFGSPFIWVLSALGQMKVQQMYLIEFAIAAPYPLTGLVIGYFWPLNNSGWRRVLRSVVVRFALTCLSFWTVGALFGLAALGHDS